MQIDPVFDSVLDAFVDEFQRSPNNFGSLRLSPTPLAVDVDLPLNDELRAYFARVRIEDKPLIGGAFNLFVFPPDMLVTALSGWRWVTLKSGEVVENTSFWRPAWVIIGDQNGDAIIVDTASGEVSGSIQSHKFPIAASLAAFLAALTAAMKVVREQYDFETQDDTFAPLPAFLADVEHAVRPILGDEGTAGFMEFFYG